MSMLSDFPASVSVIGEKDMRRQIDRSVSRALIDHDYARLLLTDPTVALADHGCPPQQYRSLRGIRATDLFDFARQAQQLFWIVEPKSAAAEEQLSLAAAAAR
jgi:hypothetical protein